MKRSTNAIKDFIDELPPEFEAIRHKAEKLLDAHREDVIQGYVNGAVAYGLDTTKFQAREDGEQYYTDRHTT